MKNLLISYAIFSSRKYSTFLQQIATALLQKALTYIANQQGIPGVAMIRINIANHYLKKKRSTLLRFIWWQNNFLSCVFALKMDKFVLKVKPKKKPICSITPQQWVSNIPGSSMQITISYFCSTCNVVVDHHRK